MWEQITIGTQTRVQHVDTQKKNCILAKALVVGASHFEYTPEKKTNLRILMTGKSGSRKTAVKYLMNTTEKSPLKRCLMLSLSVSWNVSIEESFKNHAEQHLPYYKSLEEFLDKNHAFLGPKNLLRARVDGRHCIGNGKGTWDLIAGEFF